MTKLIKKTFEQEIDILPNARRIASIAQKFRAKDIQGYDVRELTVLTDCFLMCSVTSEPQLKAVYHGVRDGMKEIGVWPLRAEGEISSSWLVLDYGAIIFHIFRERAYEFYDLGGLWGDAPLLDLDLDED
ncbi:MAG: ribosome silencing factor [Candidatus Hydrogenedentes bacterium]|nr:ribosome silencing factor [Candidatus Hydrogenedentota bacterium]